MNGEELLDRSWVFVKKNWLACLFAAVGILLIGVGVKEYVSQKQKESEAVVMEAPTDVKTDELLITVDVEGAVLNPGLYKLDPGSRVNDALVAASGFSNEVDAGWVEKNINLAAKIQDGAKIYIPKISQTTTIETTSSNKDSTSNSVSLPSSINVNTASSSQLDSLPGIGPVTAAKIISGRPYSAIEDLLNRKIVSSKVFSQIKDKITVY